MGVRYDSRSSSRWAYACWGEQSKGAPLCWSIPGPAIDDAVEKLFLDTMVPGELDLGIAVERQVHQQVESLENLWRARVEQTEYEARRAERRYKAVDPDNRVVARTLESDWEQRLRDVEAVQQEYAEARRQARVELTAQDRSHIRQLARDLPAVWSSSSTSMADKKAMLRLVIEAVAANPVEVPKRATRLRVQWSGGVVSELMVARLKPGEYRLHPPEAVERIRELAAAGVHDDEIAQQLNSAGIPTGGGLAWKGNLAQQARRKHGIERVAPDRQRMPPLPHKHPDGRYSVPGAAAKFDVSHNVIRAWIKKGLVVGTRADFGTHRNVVWLDIDDVTAQRLTNPRGTRR
jgi:hypothetical protein